MIEAGVQSTPLDQSTQGKLRAFTLARLLLLTAVLFTTIFLRQEVLGPATIMQIYGAVGASFLLSMITVAWWEETLRVRYFLASQLLYDLLLTSYLVYLTGVSDSIFLFLYLLNITFASVTYRLPGALVVAAASGSTFAVIFMVNSDTDLVSSWYDLGWHELLFLLTALLSGQLMEELRRQRAILEAQREDIRRLELLTDRLINSIPVGVVVVDADYYVQKISATALRLVGLERPPAGRLRYDELLPTLRGAIPAWDQLPERRRHRFLFGARDGDAAHLSLQVVKARDEHQRPQYILVFQDMAQTMELERKLEWETKLAATGELAAGIAHEIRNPLASISGCIELLAQQTTDGGTADHRLLEISLREIRRLNALITDFLEFAKPKDDRAEEFPLRALLQEVADTVLAGGPGAEARIEVAVPVELPVFANRERLQQVFLNLFLNSVEAAGPDGARIRIEATAADANVDIDVRDEGPGIPPAVAARIFDPFFTTKESGTGLGLATVAQVLKAAKGEIHLIASPRGAHFRIRLPRTSVTMEGTEKQKVAR